MQEVRLIGEPLTKDYYPSINVFGTTWNSLIRYPCFALRYVRDMLVDSKIKFGLFLIKGMILSKGTFSVEAENEEVGEFVKQTLERFKLTGMSEALNNLSYGYSCSEMMYEGRQGFVHYKEAKALHPIDCKPVRSERTGNLAGAAVRISNSKFSVTNSALGRIILGGPKVLWSVHDPDYNPWYGLSRLYNAFMPWLEKWADGGFRDCRRLFFYKQAYSGGIMYHPPGDTLITVDSSTGQAMTKPNRDIAREMVDNLRTGGTVFLPSVSSMDGQSQWRWEPGQALSAPEALFNYGKTLDEEILEGMGIPTEVVQAAGESSGAYGGRSVPMEAFSSILHAAYCGIISDFVKQIVHPLVILNYGHQNSWFQVRPYGLLSDTAEVNQGEGQIDDEAQGLSGKEGDNGKQAVAMSIRLEAERALRKRGYVVQGGGGVNYA